ncbi:MAG: hypothetical protein E6G69_10090 [Alphaproteobacteria bacterium]|nr:MAG: hypothetical protein E6G69_10090 [Alphaproteobacteria bacterium]
MMLPVGFWIVAVVQMYFGVVPCFFRSARTPAQADGTLTTTSFEFAAEPEFYSGGGTLYSTAGDYLRFLQMLLHGGELNGARILRPETVALINRNHIGELQAGSVPSRMPSSSSGAATILTPSRRKLFR